MMGGIRAPCLEAGPESVTLKATHHGLISVPEAGVQRPPSGLFPPTGGGVLVLPTYYRCLGPCPTSTALPWPPSLLSGTQAFSLPSHGTFRVLPPLGSLLRLHPKSYTLLLPTPMEVTGGLYPACGS